MDLQEALEQIDEIHCLIRRSETFRGYRATAVAMTAGVAVLTGLVQPVLCPQPFHHVDAFLLLWVTAAVVSLLLCGVETLRRYRNESPGRTRLTRVAIEQMLPAFAAGGLLTLVIVTSAIDVAWMLPGLWSILLALGVFSSAPILPRATFWVGVWYLVMGVAVLMFGRGDWALAPWTMVLPFGGGQLLSAGVLYWTLERRLR